MTTDNDLVFELCQRGDFRGAVERILLDRGVEIRTLMRTIESDWAVVEDAYALFSEDVWRGLPGFEGRAQLRTWLYRIAINAVARARRGRPTTPHLGDDWLARLVEQSRHSTQPYLRSDVKDRFRELREQLSEDERLLLMLRVDRGLEYAEIAEVLGGEQTATALRQRFHRVKDKLKHLARRAGLLDHES